jgi:hypothetical protein
MIQEAKTIDFTAALDSPTSFFAEPQDVVIHSQLSREQKVAILRRWEQDCAGGNRTLFACRLQRLRAWAAGRRACWAELRPHFGPRRAISRGRGSLLASVPERARISRWLPPPQPGHRMFTVDEATAEAIRRAYDEGGELSGIVEFRRHFPLITDNVKAGECVRIVAGWKPRPPQKRLAEGE